MQPEDLYDWDLACARLAAQEPWWEPGTASGYHAVTQGYLVGEVIRRIDGRSVGRFFAEEVAGPLGADFFIGTPASADDRVARVIPPPSLEDQVAGGRPRPSIPLRTLLNPPLSAEQSWTEAWRRAEIPAAGGHGNARSVARRPGRAGPRRRARRRAPAVRSRLPPGPGAPDRWPRPGAGRAPALRPGLRPAVARGAAQPQPARLLLGRLGRLAGGGRHGCPAVRGLCHEPHGRGHHGRHPRPSRSCSRPTARPPES